MREKERRRNLRSATTPFWQTENRIRHVPGHATFNVSSKARIPRHEARFRVCTRPLMESPLPRQINPLVVYLPRQEDKKRNETDLWMVTQVFSIRRLGMRVRLAMFLSDVPTKSSA